MLWGTKLARDTDRNIPVKTGIILFRQATAGLLKNHGRILLFCQGMEEAEDIQIYTYTLDKETRNSSKNARKLSFYGFD